MTTLVQRSAILKIFSINPKGLTAVNLNANENTNIKSHIELLRERINEQEKKPQIIFVQETKIDEKIKDENVAIAGYQIFRRDYNCNGGGIAIYIENSIEIVGKPYYNPIFEAMSVTIDYNKIHITLTNVLKPQNMSKNTFWNQLQIHYAITSVNSQYSVMGGELCFDSEDVSKLQDSMFLIPINENAINENHVNTQLCLPFNAEIIEQHEEKPFENLQNPYSVEFKLVHDIDPEDKTYKDPKCMTALKEVCIKHGFFEKYKSIVTPGTPTEENNISMKGIFKFFMDLNVTLESVNEVLKHIEAEHNTINKSLELHLQYLHKLYFEYKVKLTILSKMPAEPDKPILEWKTEKAKEWKEVAVEAQVSFTETNGKIMWERFDRYDLLETTLCIAIFGKHFKPGASLESTLLFVYDHAQRQVAQIIRKKMWKKADTTSNIIDMTVVYITVKFENDTQASYPVFAFKSKDGTISYFDHFANWYKDWNTYLNRNTLEKCMMCVPMKGFYGSLDINNNEEIKYMFCESPSCGTIRRILTGAFTTVKYVTAALPILSIFVPPLLAAYGLSQFSSAYFIVQESIKYINVAIAIGTFAFTSLPKIWHFHEWPGQDIFNLVIALANVGTEYLNKWIVTNALENGTVLTALQSVILTIMNTTVFAITATSTISAFCVLLFKEKIEPSDLINLSLSLYYLYGAWTRPKTAEGVYNELKKEFDNQKQYQEQLAAMKKEQKLKEYGELAEELQKPESEISEERREQIKKEYDKLYAENLTNPHAKTYFDENIKGKTLKDNQKRNPVNVELIEELYLIRLMLQVDNAKDFFCELTSAKTTFKFETNGEILVNNKHKIHPYRLNDLAKSNQPPVKVINPDGTVTEVSVAERRCTLISQVDTNPAAKAELDSLQASDREIFFRVTSDMNRCDNISTTIQSYIPIWKYFHPKTRPDDNIRNDQYAYFHLKYDLMFEHDCTNAKNDLCKIFPEMSKDPMFCDLTPTELGMLKHVLDDINDPNIWKAAKPLAQNNDCSNVREFCDYVKLTKIIANEPMVRDVVAQFQGENNQFDGKLLHNLDVQDAMMKCIEGYKNQVQHILTKNDTIWDNTVSAMCCAIEKCREENFEGRQISEKVLENFLLKDDPYDINSLSPEKFRVETGYTQDGIDKVNYIINLETLPPPPEPGIPKNLQWTAGEIIDSMISDAVDVALLFYGASSFRKFPISIIRHPLIVKSLKNPKFWLTTKLIGKFFQKSAVTARIVKRSADIKFKGYILPATVVRKMLKAPQRQERRYKIRAPENKYIKMPPVSSNIKRLERPILQRNRKEIQKPKTSKTKKVYQINAFLQTNKTLHAKDKIKLFQTSNAITDKIKKFFARKRLRHLNFKSRHKHVQFKNELKKLSAHKRHRHPSRKHDPPKISFKAHKVEKKMSVLINALHLLKKTFKLKDILFQHFFKNFATSTTQTSGFKNYLTKQQNFIHKNLDKIFLQMNDIETGESKSFLVAPIDFPPSLHFKGVAKMDVPSCGLEHIVFCNGYQFTQYIDGFTIDFFTEEQNLMLDQIHNVSDMIQQNLLNNIHESIAQNEITQNRVHLLQIKIAEFLRKSINAVSYINSYNSSENTMQHLFKLVQLETTRILTVTTTNQPFKIASDSHKWLEITTATIEDLKVVINRLNNQMH